MEPEGLDANLAMPRNPAAAGAQGAERRDEFFGQTEAHPGLRIVDQPPADLLLMPLRRLGKPRALIRAEQARLLAVAALLKGLDGLDRARVVEIAAGRPVVIVRQSETGLDGEPLDRRHRLISFHGCGIGPRG